ncbi:hypothetical protein ACFVP8_20230 [Viridibacillus arvi]
MQCDIEIKREDNIEVTNSKYNEGEAPNDRNVLIDFGGGEGYYNDWIV